MTGGFRSRILPLLSELKMRYICTCCGYIYDPAQGDELNSILPGVEFDNLPEAWVCPLCYATQDKFDPLD
jgi:rubredoxin